jgi:hypothetical protein
VDYKIMPEFLCIERMALPLLADSKGQHLADPLRIVVYNVHELLSKFGQNFILSDLFSSSYHSHRVLEAR